MMAGGKSAQSHAAKAAVPNPAIRFAAKKTGMQAAEEKMIFSKTAANKARVVKIPKLLYPRDHQWINGRKPCRGAGVHSKYPAESLALGQRIGDVAGFLLKRNNG
jgi:hypothetical protein